MPHMSNLPWMVMFVTCLMSIWTLIVIFNFNSDNKSSLDTLKDKNHKNNEANTWEW